MEWLATNGVGALGLRSQVRVFFFSLLWGSCAAVDSGLPLGAGVIGEPPEMAQGAPRCAVVLFAVSFLLLTQLGWCRSNTEAWAPFSRRGHSALHAAMSLLVCRDGGRPHWPQGLSGLRRWWDGAFFLIALARVIKQGPGR